MMKREDNEKCVVSACGFRFKKMMAIVVSSFFTSVAFDCLMPSACAHTTHSVKHMLSMVTVNLPLPLFAQVCSLAQVIASRPTFHNCSRRLVQRKRVLRFSFSSFFSINSVHQKNHNNFTKTE